MPIEMESIPQVEPGKQEMREERVIDTYTKPTSKPTTIEAPPAAAPNPPASTTLSPEATINARKEQAFRKQQAEFKTQQAALEADRKEVADLKALKAKIAAKDYTELEKLVSYDDYTNYLIEKDRKSTPEQDAISKLSSEIENVKKAQADDVQKRFEAAVNDRRQAVKKLVTDSSDYSTIKELAAEEHVVQHILDTWEHDSIDLTPEDAAKEVEELLVEHAKKYASVSKLKPAAPEKRELPPLKVKTLTNSMAATGDVKRPQKSLSDMSDNERYKEARRRVEERLKAQQ